jgi:starch phosphorylase
MVISPARLKEQITGKLQRHFGKEYAEATQLQIYKACTLVVRDFLMEQWIKTQERIEEQQAKQLYYLSMEFLMGKSLKNNICNLEIDQSFEEALGQLGYSIEDIYAVEEDAGLGNGGLGRLATCYMDALASCDYPACGFSILYEYGIFRQKIIDGNQIELPDSWLDTGDSWLVSHIEDAQEIRFNGTIEEYWENGKIKVRYKDYFSVLAVPYDMMISGYRSNTVNTLRLWSAKSPNTIDMKLFSQGEYVRAIEQKSLAEVISKVLYPDDNHYEGKSLRLKQQYFLVSATVLNIVKKHMEQYGTLSNLHEKIILHINDTHPALVIPELMRILMDDYSLGWDEAWDIITKVTAYTNHTVMSEALERWPVSLFSTLLPRIYQIVQEINERFCRTVFSICGNWEKVSRMAIIAYGEVRMANLCICASFCVNGVSNLHSNIIKEQVFRDFYDISPQKFTNVTNGIAHRRFLHQANPKLSALICECIGDGFLNEPELLKKFEAFCDDKEVLSRLASIKKKNKEELSKYILEKNHIRVDVDAIFDVQAKRLHEYKRQLLNIMHILNSYYAIKDNPGGIHVPRTYLFAAKAPAGYYMAKRIIKLIHSVASQINDDLEVSRYLKVVFLEDYKVSLAERLIPASEVSEQISVAGKEASGTGNMKFMLNGALTVGTLDGANVEMSQVLGEENIFLFGLKAKEVEELVKRGKYNPLWYYQNHIDLKRILDHLNFGIGIGVLHDTFSDITNSLLFGGQGGMADPYFVLADFDSCCATQKRVEQTYLDPHAWNKKSVINIAASGIFSADRSVTEYAQQIWRLKKV